jgi:colicin import membrane protein
LDLKEIKGIGDPTIKKLNKSGVKSVEQLALIDTRKRKVPGVDADRVIKLRRMAQKTIFLSAAERVRLAANIAKKRVEKGAKTVEHAARLAAERAVDAAKMAEASAAAAIAHAEKRAGDLAKQAAEQAVQARLVATQQLHALRERIAQDRKNPKSKVAKYFELLERAEKAAQTAADKAVEAAARAGQAGAEAAQQAGEKGKSFYDRLMGKMRAKK